MIFSVFLVLSFAVAVTKQDIFSKLKNKIEGTRLSTNANIRAGTIIFSHVKRRSNSVVKKWHIAVLLKISKTHIWVMDQNNLIRVDGSSDVRGVIEIHKIMFGNKVTKSNPDKYYDTSNAYNYHILEI